MCGGRRIHRITKSTPLAESRTALEGIVQKFPAVAAWVPYRRVVALCSAVLTALAGAAVVDGGTAVAAAGPTTAWQHGDFALDPTGVVSRSDIVLGSPNSEPTASMPLGNGSLGVAAWAAGGFTAQLNRSDTMPDRKSPGLPTSPACPSFHTPPTSADSWT